MQIGKADLDRKLSHAQEFLSKGEQVQVQIFLKGRQRNHPERAIEFLQNTVSESLEDFGKKANEPSSQRLSITFNPKKH